MIAKEALGRVIDRDEYLEVSEKEAFVLYDGTFVDKPSGSKRHFEIQLAATLEQRVAAEQLINEMYQWRGYGSDHRLSASANCFTFNATIDGELVGTISLTVDMHTGLAADNTFRDVLDDMRSSAGVQICELTKFAFCSTRAPMHVIASLFHTIFIFGTQKFACTDLFIEVNPRHIRFYEVLLGFSLVGALRSNASVDAPAQLMRLRVSDIGRYISTFAEGNADLKSGRSLYPYFLTAAQEVIIHERMAVLNARWPFGDTSRLS